MLDNIINMVLSRVKLAGRRYSDGNLVSLR